MPTPATANFPAPESDDEFDDMVADALRLRFQNTHLVRFGRSGQRQHGIDGLDPTVPMPESIVWQATLQQHNLYAKITDDLEALDTALLQQPKLFVAALGNAKRDTELQLQLQELASSRRAQGKCPILSLVWADIRDDLCMDERVMRKHFAAFFAPTPPLAPAVSPQERYRGTLARLLAEGRNRIWFVSRMKFVHQPSRRRFDFQKTRGLHHADLVSVPATGLITMKMRRLNYYHSIDGFNYLVQTSEHDLQISVDHMTAEPSPQDPTGFINMYLSADLVLDYTIWTPDQS